MGKLIGTSLRYPNLITQVQIRFFHLGAFLLNCPRRPLILPHRRDTDSDYRQYLQLWRFSAGESGNDGWWYVWESAATAGGIGRRVILWGSTAADAAATARRTTAGELFIWRRKLVVRVETCSTSRNRIWDRRYGPVWRIPLRWSAAATRAAAAAGPATSTDESLRSIDVSTASK